MEEEMEKTKLLKTLFVDKDEISIVEKIEEFEDTIDYLDMTKEKKEKIIKLCEEIKKEDDENSRKFLFELLKKEVR